jgi:hypothetical protein
MTKFVQGTPQKAAELWQQSTVFGPKKSPDNRSDFGDDTTVGLSLRRVGLSFDHPFSKMDECFGVYLGHHPGDGYVVGNKKFDYSGWAGCELFASLEDLKQRWELD